MKISINYVMRVVFGLGSGFGFKSDGKMNENQCKASMRIKKYHAFLSSQGLSTDFSIILSFISEAQFSSWS